MKKIIIFLVILILTSCSTFQNETIVEEKEIPKNRSYNVNEIITFDLKQVHPNVYDYYILGINDDKVFVSFRITNEKYIKKTAENDWIINGPGQFDTFGIGYIDLKDNTYHTLKNLEDRKGIKATGIAYHNGNYLYRVNDWVNNKNYTYYVKEGNEIEVYGDARFGNFYRLFSQFENKVISFSKGVENGKKIAYVNLFNLDTGENKVLRKYDPLNLYGDNEKGEEILMLSEAKKNEDNATYVTFKDGVHKVYKANPFNEEVLEIESHPKVFDMNDLNEFQFITYIGEHDAKKLGFLDKKTNEIIKNIYKNSEKLNDSEYDNLDIYFHNVGSLVDEDYLYIVGDDISGLKDIFEATYKDSEIHLKSIGVPIKSEFLNDITLRLIGFDSQKNIIVLEQNFKQDSVINLKIIEITR